MKKIGIGRMATVYKINNNQVLKLFNKGVSMDHILDEYNKSKLINDLGISSPKIYDLIERDEQVGILYQFIEGKTYLKILMSNEEMDSDPGSEMAKVHLNIHNSISIDLVDIKDVIKSSLESVDLDTSVKQKILNYIMSLPDGDTVCHLDFHPDNLIKNRNNFTVIDWANVVKGYKAADVYNTIYTISSGTVPPETPKDVEDILNTFRREISAKYFEYYIQNSDITKEDVYRWRLPILIYRLSQGISEENDDLIRKINALAKEV